MRKVTRPGGTGRPGFFAHKNLRLRYRKLDRGTAECARRGHARAVKTFSQHYENLPQILRALTGPPPPVVPTLLGAALPAAMIWSSAAQAATRVVANCNDSGTGSLRAAVAGAASGDTIDMRSLTCSRILLASQIDIPQADLTLTGPGRFALTLDGNRASRVFAHSGVGRLYIDRMSIANGRGPAAQPVPPDGGCILSNGTVELWRSRVHHCEAPALGWETGWGSALGGGIKAVNVELNYSSVFSNKTTGEGGTGGGIYGQTVRMYYSQVYGNAGTDNGGGGVAGGDVSAHYSLIHGNSAHNGGGIACSRLTLNKSTVSANRAMLFEYFGRWMENQGGGVFVSGTGRNLVVDSTISGNAAFNYSAADFGKGETVVYNSTITDNLENYPEGYDSPFYPPEYFGRGAVRAGTLRLQSSIVAGNRRTEGTPAYDVAPESTVSGSRNVIGHSQVATPADTLVTDAPGLAALADNGGPTRTHLPLAGSPVIDRGSNPLNREFDQRGAGFPREKGAGVDIGSVER